MFAFAKVNNKSVYSLRYFLFRHY